MIPIAVAAVAAVVVAISVYLKKHKILRMAARPAVLMALCVIVWAVSIPAARAAQECLSATGEAAVSACRRELLHDPDAGSFEVLVSKPMYDSLSFVTDDYPD